MSDKKERTLRRAVSLRLPAELVEDCEEQAGEGKWQTELRNIVNEAAKRRRKVKPPAKSIRMDRKTLSMDEKTLAWLESEAERLTSETGDEWTVAGVVREFWAASVARRDA